MIMLRWLLAGAGGHQAPLGFSAAAVAAALRPRLIRRGSRRCFWRGEVGGRMVFVDCSREAVGVGLTSRQLLCRGPGIMEGRSYSWRFLAV